MHPEDHKHNGFCIPAKASMQTYKCVPASEHGCPSGHVLVDACPSINTLQDFQKMYDIAEKDCAGHLKKEKLPHVNVPHSGKTEKPHAKTAPSDHEPTRKAAAEHAKVKAAKEDSSETKKNVDKAHSTPAPSKHDPAKVAKAEDVIGTVHASAGSGRACHSKVSTQGPEFGMVVAGQTVHPVSSKDEKETKNEKEHVEHDEEFGMIVSSSSSLPKSTTSQRHGSSAGAKRVGGRVDTGVKEIASSLEAPAGYILGALGHHETAPHKKHHEEKEAQGAYLSQGQCGHHSTMQKDIVYE